MKRWFFGLSVVASLSAQDTIEHGRPLNLNQIPSGISESARFEVRDSWGFGLNAHFTEYAASEDSMEIAYISDLVQNPQGSVACFDSNFKPGVEVGFVLNTPYDHWNIQGEYLYYHGSEVVSKTPNSTLYYSAPIFYNVGSFQNLLTSIESSFDLNINCADLYLLRPFYSGKNLTLEPLMGLKSAFIKQDFDLRATPIDVVWETQTASTKSISWGIGPKLGLQANYLLGLGFTLFGDLSTSLLYTTYTKLHADYVTSTDQKAFASNNNAQLVQPVIDSGIGLSFGSYAFNKSFHVNVTAAYNFSVFYSQNMARALVSVANSTQAIPANLYLQGVSVGLALVF